MNRCFGCFEPIADTEKICPHCGFTIKNYEVQKWILIPGTVLNGKYLIGRILGEGGFGITYLAWDVNMETRVAIKEYYPGYLVSRDVTSASGNVVTMTAVNGNNDFQTGLKRYVKEAATLSKFFELPGIVSIKDFFYENETAYIVMEYIDGVSLKKVLEQRGGTIPVGEALQLIQPVVSSLAVIHKNKILHRDISPDNIMVDKNGNVKLIDFGAARYFDIDGEKSMTVMLKHGYAPVEQYSRNGEQVASADVYALCAVLYRMITGKIPVEATERIRADGLMPIRSLAPKTPKYIATAIEKGLSVMPENRQQSMEELYSELYISKKGRVSRAAEKLTDKIYRLIRRLLIFLIICLGIVVCIGIVYRLNSDKIERFFTKIEKVFDEDTIQHIETEEDDVEKIEEKRDRKDTKTDIMEETDANELSNDSRDNRKEMEEAQTTSDESSYSDSTQIDPAVERGIMVARDGYLNGRTESMTVGDILDAYSDSSGNWLGYVDEGGNVFIYYQGSKNGESFAIQFEVFSDDTFKITGAARNGEQIEAYSDFFQQILSEVGV